MYRYMHDALHVIEQVYDSQGTGCFKLPFSWPTTLTCTLDYVGLGQQETIGKLLSFRVSSPEWKNI